MLFDDELKRLDLIEDKIEFFNFIPSSLLAVFIKDLEEILNECFSNKKFQYLQPKITSLFKHHMTIFKAFSLRNIFNFPEDFLWERKQTDLLVDANVNKELKELIELQNTLETKNNLYQNKMYELIELENRNKGYKCTFANNTKLSESNKMVEKLEKELKFFLEKTNLENVASEKVQKQVKKFLENKYLKNEFYKEEKNKLLQVAKTEDIEDLTRKIF
ncbi:hypothetical protein EHP00_499 [Ecytonucleospora hepatopenaei]|uniref:Uncharacterized protein n=1 Tax=Ecytonucleospora hepatopenaei TaxID=646526 RepID=A0A1W0E457_9MICR|nr:hypothetical protein EHP00_499 [Ecytonucleospora hepatopenaei]